MFELLASLPSLNVFEYSVVDNFFSMTVASMGAAAIFFFLARTSVAPKYRPALMVSGIVVAIACYHYFMIRQSWGGAFTFSGGEYVPSGKGFNDFYRYADWILTVPLLMVELVLVMNLEKGKSRTMLTKLVIAAALMIGLGYPGEIIDYAEGYTARIVWGVLSSIPFFYILYVLWFELTKAIESQPPQARRLLEVGRLVILVTWAVYPIAYALGGHALLYEEGSAGWLSGSGLVAGEQIAYAVADVTAKAGFGLLTFFIARAKSDAEGWYESAPSNQQVAASAPAS
ncbi:MAG: bacteriorhodopsin-like [Gemmataceae bacterium]